ncbi:hypothetical protein RHGRI_037385 [Rhododendron griersonianum]|nr:hypothetical protein RHGRI_037385 [Rhododendron griersonianum]
MSHDTKILCSIFLLLLQYQFQFCTPTDTINTTQSLKDGDLLISSNQTFALGFFTPGKSTNWYLGIWYNKVSEQTFVWVANRGDPINDTSGSLSFDVTGNLVVTGPDRSNLVWSTNVSDPTVAKISSAQLLDSGNLVVLDGNGEVVWQSFDYPTNTLLPNMRFGVNRKTGLDRFVTSWKSGDDPGPGEYSMKMDLNGSPQSFVYKGSVLVWRTGSWIGRGLSGIPEMTINYINHNYVENQDEVTITFSIRDPLIFSRLVLNESGMLQRLTWNNNEHRWVEIYVGPKKPCDSYNNCGPNGICDQSNIGRGQFECMCLPGFEPKSERDWYLRDGSGGCVRKRGGHVCGSGEGFEKVPLAKVPNMWTARVDRGVTGLKECESECLRNCLCNAYASADVSRGDSGCVKWHGDLMDSRVFSSGGQDLYIRVDAVELDWNNPVWSTNVSDPTLAKNSSAQLLDSGNLVVLDSNGVVVWQSFDYPTNTLLPNLRFGVNWNTGLDRFLTSWKSGDDPRPRPGEYSFKIDLNGSPDQLFLYKGSGLVWRAGSWIGRGWSGVPKMTTNFIFNLSYVENQDEVTLSYSILDPSISSRLVLNKSGRSKGTGQFECTCLPRFEPTLARDWYLRDGSGGCVRKRGGHVCGSGEGFEKVPLAKEPNTRTTRVDRGVTGLKE